MMTLILALAGLTPAALPLPAQEGAAHSKFALHAAHVRTVGNEVLHDAVLIVDKGKIVSLESAAKAGALDVPVVEHDGWLSAGLVSCRTYAGTAGDTSEAKRSLTPDARIADAIDVHHPDFERALSAGVTTVLVVPAPNTLAAGQSAVVKTHGGRFVSKGAHLALSFSAQALRYNRYPTSYASAAAELAKQLDAREGVWGKAAKGELPVLVDALTRDEIQRAAAFAAARHLRGALCRAPLAGELAAEVKASGLAVIVGPFEAGTSQRELDSVVALAKERVPLAFGADAPWSSDEALRFSAALCVRAGLDAATAWDALTANAASVAGVGDSIGKLARGYDADIVLWSGDPLDLSSRVQAVFIDGAQAFGGGK